MVFLQPNMSSFRFVAREIARDLIMKVLKRNISGK